MKLFISISAYDAILDASIASILCKKKLTDHKVYTSLSYSKKDLKTNEYKKYFDQISFIDAKRSWFMTYLQIMKFLFASFTQFT